MKRITIFAGHYGSGKTNIAINYAFKLKEHNGNVAIADLDIVNPYFRTKDAESILEDNGIELISSPYANSNVDTPALPAETYSIIHDKSISAVIDVGGDDRGALALGRYAESIVSEGDYEMLFVVNKYRYLTKTADETIEVMREIEEAGKVKFTGIVNNSNLGEETTLNDVLESMEYANEISKKTGLPVRFTTVNEEISAEGIENAMPIKIYVTQK